MVVVVELGPPGVKLPKELWMKMKRSTDMAAMPTMVMAATTMKIHSQQLSRLQLRTFGGREGDRQRERERERERERC